jgi:hypothetical protein
MDRIQELMEQGRMAEAQQALEELQQMMENLRLSESNQGGEGGQSSAQGLADLLQDQQDLSDDAFNDLQEEFANPNDQEGQDEQQGSDFADRQGQLRERLDRERSNIEGAQIMRYRAVQTCSGHKIQCIRDTRGHFTIARRLFPFGKSKCPAVHLMHVRITTR